MSASLKRVYTSLIKVTRDQDADHDNLLRNYLYITGSVHISLQMSITWDRIFVCIK
jgi:hypothetical protein